MAFIEKGFNGAAVLSQMYNGDVLSIFQKRSKDDWTEKDIDDTSQQLVVYLQTGKLPTTARALCRVDRQPATDDS